LRKMKKEIVEDQPVFKDKGKTLTQKQMMKAKSPLSEEITGSGMVGYLTWPQQQNKCKLKQTMP